LLDRPLAMDWRHSWRGVVHFSFAQDISAPPDEELVWRDDASPLRIATIGKRNQHHYRLRPGDWMFADVLDNDHVVSKAKVGASRRDHDHFLADQVIPRLIAHTGKLVLHAGGIEVGGRAVLFLGASGHGKSTLCASFRGTGHRLLGDDAIIIGGSEASPKAAAVYPSLRLLPDSFSALLPGESDEGLVADYSDKKRASLERLESGSLPIGAIFILADGPSPTGVHVRPVNGAQSTMAIVQNSFALDPSDFDRAAERLKAAASLARHVPAFVLEYPRSYDCLGEVRAAILAQVAPA
jgi:hypothetical protein